jgi:hypothetical protein
MSIRAMLELGAVEHSGWSRFLHELRFVHDPKDPGTRY